MALNALLCVALIGMLALVIDLGYLAGLRRFMQNGADAGALAAARRIAADGIIAPTGSFPVSIALNHASAIDTATALAEENRTAGIAAKTTAFAVQLDYCVAATPADYDYVAGCRVDVDGDWLALAPTEALPDGVYMVRVRVASTVGTFFGGVIGIQAMTASAQAVAMILGACPAAAPADSPSNGNVPGVAPVLPPNTATCGLGPSPYGNIVRLGQ